MFSRPTIILALILGVATLALLRPAPAEALRPAAEYTQVPEQAGITYDDVRFRTPDGVELHGWFFPFQDREGNAIRDPAPIIILTPTEEGNMGANLWHYFRFLRGAPWHVLVFDWRGFGTSAEWPIDPDVLIMPEFVSDLHGAVNFARTLPEWDEEHIGVYATFMAGAVALATLAERDDVNCLAIRGIYTSQADLAANFKALDPATQPKVNERWPEKLEPIQVATRVHHPVFLVVGDEDPVTTVKMAEQVYQALPAKRQLWVAKGAGHRGEQIPEVVKMPEFTAKLHAFYRRYLGTAGH